MNCEETQYEVKLSSSDWPSQDYVVRNIEKDIMSKVLKFKSVLPRQKNDLHIYFLSKIGGSEKKVWLRKSVFWWIWIQGQLCSDWSLFPIVEHKTDL